jgi:hypothetical protein
VICCAIHSAVNADWTDDEARAAVAQILPLAGRPDDSYLTRPAEPESRS